MMSDSSNPKGSSLDPEMLRILEAAQAGEPSALLDDDPLVNSSLFDENAPLVPVPEAYIASSSARPGMPLSTGEEDLLGAAESTSEDYAPESAPEPAPAVESPAPVAASAPEPVPAPEPAQRLAPVAMDAWLGDEPPLTQAMLDDMFAEAERLRIESPEQESATDRPEDLFVQAPPASDVPLHEDSPVSDAAVSMSQADLDSFFAAEAPAEPTADVAENEMSQVDLDAPLAGNAAPEPAPEIDVPMSQAELDALLAGSAAPAPEDDAPMSQAELDALLAGSAAPAHESAPEDDAPMSQAELDALLAGNAAPEPAPEDDAPMSQAELDALLAGSAAPAPEDDAPMSQAELDALLAGSAAPAPEPAPEDDAPMSQAELDALLAGTSAEPASLAPEAPLYQDDLDALVGDLSKPPVAPKVDAPLSQADLDALLAGASTPPSAPMQEDDAPMSQAELDALLAGAASPESASTPSKEAPLSQADLDALLGSPSTPAQPPAAFAEEAPLSQDDLDALISGLGGQATATSTPTPTDTPLSQADLDALLGGLSTAPAQPPAPAPADSLLSQDALDSLLNGASTNAPDRTEPASLLNQDDLDALLDAAAASSPHDRTLAQDDLTALFNAAAVKNHDDAANAPARSLALSQADLDALLAGAVASMPGKDDVATLSDDDLTGLFDESTGAVLARKDDGPLDQASIDALLSGKSDDQVLDNSTLDTPIAAAGDVYDDDVSLSRSSIDSLMADLDSAGALASQSPTADNDDDETGEISQDMIDALIATAQAQSSGSSAPAAISEIGSENFAAAATAAASDSGPELLSQSDLDRLIEESRQQDKARSQAKQRALEEAISAAQSAARSDGGAPDLLEAIQSGSRPPRKPSVVLAFVRNNGARVAASLLMGGLVALTTGVILHLNREVIRDESTPQAGAELEVALERAREDVARGDYPAAIAELEDPVNRAMPGATRNDALYVLLEARYRSSKAEYGSDAFDDLTALIDDTVAQASTHPRAPEALSWRAQMFMKDDPRAALDTYEKIFDQYADAPGLDKMLLDASKLALNQKDPLTSSIYAQDLLRRFPNSPLAGEAILAVGDANQIAGNEADARATFQRIAESEPDSRLGAQAFLRLGRLAYDAGQYGQAIDQLTKRLDTTTTTAGNDEVYLLLAQSYRKAGRLNEARDTLNDLLTIFEPGPVTPKAYIEYSQVLEDLGDREKAAKTAQRAAMEYPEDPGVLRNNGELLGLNGNPLAAAEALVAAEKAGAADPNSLLTAARYYRTANMPDEAARVYDQVKTNYGGSSAALAGGVEAAQLRYAEGDAEGALDALKSLQEATRGTEFYLSAIQAMQDIYQDLGLADHVQSLAKEIVAQSDAPDVLARTAINLIDSGDLESAQKAIEKIDLSHLQKPVAFELLMKEGNALLSVAPQRGLEKMEEAHFNYPEARTREADQQLLKTYLATGRPAAARRMVMELKAGAAEKPSDAPYLVDAANAWGDYLYDQGDYRTAIFAYTMAEEAGPKPGTPIAGLRTSPDWSQYQRANALLRLGDYEGCVALYDKIGASASPWAGEATVKAGLARLEQRQRGIEMPLPPQTTAQAQNPAQTG